MPALKDEMIFQADGFISIDPAFKLHDLAEAFVRSRQWSTPSVFYGDQPETEVSPTKPVWSITFGLGLDHVSKTTADWFSDVAAIIAFLQPIAREHRCEFILEYRLSSRLWYSETLGHITDDSSHEIDLDSIRNKLQHLTRQRRTWWQRLITRGA